MRARANYWRSLRFHTRNSATSVFPLHPLFFLSLGFPSCSSARSFSSLPWSLAKGHPSFLSSITAALLLIKDTHRHRHTHTKMRTVLCPLSARPLLPPTQRHTNSTWHMDAHLSPPSLSSPSNRDLPWRPLTRSPAISKQACFHSPARRLMVQSGPGSYLGRPEGGSV